MHIHLHLHAIDVVAQAKPPLLWTTMHFWILRSGDDTFEFLPSSLSSFTSLETSGSLLEQSHVRNLICTVSMQLVISSAQPCTTESLPLSQGVVFARFCLQPWEFCGLQGSTTSTEVTQSQGVSGLQSCQERRG
jgi:hypothetical protein